MSRKMRVLISGGAILCIGWGLYCLFAPSSETSLSGSSSRPREVLAEEWVEYRPESGLFFAQLPGVPQHASESVPVPGSNDSIAYDMYLTQSSSGSSFLIHLIRYPISSDPGNGEVLMDSIIGNLVSAKSSNKILAKTRCDFLGFPATDFKLQAEQSAVFGRVFVSGKTVYILTISDVDPIQGEAVFNRFISAFHVSEDQAPVKEGSSPAVEHKA